MHEYQLICTKYSSTDTQTIFENRQKMSACLPVK